MTYGRNLQKNTVKRLVKYKSEFGVTREEGLEQQANPEQTSQGKGDAEENVEDDELVGELDNLGIEGRKLPGGGKI